MNISYLFKNTVLVAALLSFFSAQILKLLIYYIQNKKLDLSMFMMTGSMPSSHAAIVTSLVVGFYMDSGFNTPAFTLAAVLAIIVMHDAANVRMSVGKQAQILNRIVLEMLKERQFKAEKIKEVLGHTPLEVFVGALIGVFVTITVFLVG